MGETLDFFRGRLESMIDLAHPLAVLGTSLPWAQIEADLAATWQRPSRDGTLQQSSRSFAFKRFSAPPAASKGSNLHSSVRNPRQRSRKFPCMAYARQRPAST